MFSEQVGKCIIMTVNKEKSGASKCEASPSPWIPPIHTHTHTFFPTVHAVCLIKQRPGSQRSPMLLCALRTVCGHDLPQPEGMEL